MRLLFVNYEYPPLGGGGGVACHAVATALARQAHEVHVLTSAAPGLPPASLEDGVHVWRAPVLGRSRRDSASLLSLLSFHPAGLSLGNRLCGAHAFDLVASWFVVPSGTVGRRLAARFDLPHAVLIMGSDIYGPAMWFAPPQNPLLGPLIRRILDGAHLRIAPSLDLATRARLLHGARVPIEIVPHGLAPWPGAGASRPPRPPGTPIQLLGIARLVPRKQTGTLLEALALLPDLDLRLTLVGDGPERPRLEALAASLGLTPRVRFTGHVDEAEKHRHLAAADLFALASTHEGFGLVYLEAMQHALPVIAATTGGQTEFLQHGRTGSLVEPGNPTALAQAIRHLATNPATRHHIAAHNHELARTLTVQATSSRYAALFAQAIAHHRPAPDKAVTPPVPTPPASEATGDAHRHTA